MGLLDSDFLSTLQAFQPQQEDQVALPWLQSQNQQNNPNASALAQLFQQAPQQSQGGGIGSFLSRLAASTNGAESLQKYDANQQEMQTKQSALAMLADLRNKGVTDPQKILSALATVDPQYLEKAATIQASNPLASLLQGGNNGSDTSLSGDELLKSLPPAIAAQVKGISEGKIQLPGGLGGKGQALRQQLLQLVTQYDPSFDGVNYNARAATRKDFTSGKSAQNITALNTAIGHLSSLKDAYEGLNNGDYPSWNAAVNFLGNEFGVKSIQEGTSKVGADAHAVSEELAKVFRSTGMAESDVKAWEKKLSTSSTPAQAGAVINEAMDLMNSRLDAIGQQYNQGMGTTKNGIELLSPKAQAAYAKITGSPPAQTKVSGNLAADNAASSEAKPEATKTIKGVTYIKRDGKWYAP